jgi:hypothetical protein
VVKPPQKPIVINKIVLLLRAVDLADSPSMIPMIKQPRILTPKVPTKKLEIYGLSVLLSR